MKYALECRFNKNWELARQEQQELWHKKKEQAIIKEINNYQTNIINETRCSMEIESFQLLSVESMNIEIVKWMDKYDEDYEKVEVDTQVARDQLDDSTKKRESMHAVFLLRQNKMDKYIADKAERERARIYKIVSEHAATSIQVILLYTFENIIFFWSLASIST